MNEGFKIAIAVALASFFAADFGYHVVNDFGGNSQSIVGRYGSKNNEEAIGRNTEAGNGALSILNIDGQGKKAQNNTKNSDGPGIWVIFQGLSSVFVAGFTFFLMIIGYKQAKISSRQVEVSDRQLTLMEDLERPLLLLAGVRWEVEGWRDRVDKSSFPSISISFKNFGRGVAVTDHCRIGLFIGIKPPVRVGSREERFMSALMHDEEGKQRCLHYINYYMSAGALMPQDDPWEFPFKETKISPSQIDEIGTGYQKVWIDVVVYYQDIKGKNRETHTRHVYDKDADFFAPDENAPEFNRHT